MLNFYRGYVLTFAELTKPLRVLLGQDAKPWTPAAANAVRSVAKKIAATPRWLNLDPAEELRIECRGSKQGIAILLLQRHPEYCLSWAPVASWGRCLEVLEQHDSRVILELKALREGAWKLSKFTAFAPKLVVKVSRELRALLKVSNRAHPEL